MFSRKSLPILLCLFLTPPLTAEVTPADVYAALEELSANVHEVREEMGIAPHSISNIEIYNAQPREVYYQAQTVLEKVSRLHFDILRDRPGRADFFNGDARPADVLSLVEKAASLTESIQHHLNVKTVRHADLDNSGESEKTPNDVYVLMVDLSRTLNEMIDQRFAPADTFQQVTYAISIASGVLLHEGHFKPLGDISPAIERRKTPTDVYRKLIAVNNMIHKVIKKHGGDCLLLGPREVERAGVIPGDVYDLASLVVAELSHLHKLVGSIVEPHAPYYPGRKLPSDVYQRVMQLHSQVSQLLDDQSQ